MSENANNVRTISVIVFNNNDCDRTFVQPVQNQENPQNSQNTIYTPKIKIKSLTELQKPGIINQTEGNKHIPDPHLNVLNNQVHNALANSRDVFCPITEQNCEYQNSPDHKNYCSQTTSGKLAHRNLDIWLKERSLQESLLKLEKKRALIQEMRKKTRLLFQKNQNHYSSKLVSIASTLKGKQNTLEIKDKQKIKNDAVTSIKKLEPKTQTEISNLPIAPNISNLHSVPNNNFREEIQNFEFIGVGESSYVKLGADMTLEPDSVSNSCIKSVDESKQNSAFRDCDTNYENRQTPALESNVNPSYLPNIEIADKVDSTALRDGIIKASRTLINTEKTLKLLLHIVSRNTSLPEKHAISLLRRFQGILKSFNNGFDQIDGNVKKEYKHMFSNILVDELELPESSENNKLKTESVHNKKCDIEGTATEQPDSFLNGTRLKALDNEKKSKGICRKLVRERARKSDDEELDKSFQPAAQARNFVTSRRNVPQRSCRKRHISDIFEFQEFDNEANFLI